MRVSVFPKQEINGTNEKARILDIRVAAMQFTVTAERQGARI